MDIQRLLIFIFFITTIVVVIKLNKKLKTGETNNEALTKGEKIFTIIAGILTPLIAVNGVMYYGLRKKYPTKAKQANKIGWIVLLISLVFNILLTSL